LQASRLLHVSFLALYSKIADNAIQVDLAFVHFVSFAPITLSILRKLSSKLTVIFFRFKIGSAIY
jgi:hypothetical protein